MQRFTCGIAATSRGSPANGCLPGKQRHDAVIELEM